MPNSKNYAESHADKLDYIYISPILFVLAVSIVFLPITFGTGRGFNVNTTTHWNVNE